MKYGVRKPSIKRSIKARTTGRLKRAVKSSINPLYGKKGMGYINNPKKAVYNKVYNKTTIGVNDIIKSSGSKGKSTSSKNTATSYNKTYKTNNRYMLVNYKIINNDKVIIDNKEFTRKEIKDTVDGGLYSTIFFLFIGIISLPIGIIFILLGLLSLVLFCIYKKIYNEMENKKGEEIQAIYTKYAKAALKDCNGMSIEEEKRYIDKKTKEMNEELKKIIEKNDTKN